MTTYANFRQRLDAVLRTQNVQQVRDFMLAEGQWEKDKPANAELAMWLMIAGSPTLRDLHEHARLWLLEHGHEAEAQAMLGKNTKLTKGTPRSGNGPREKQDRRPKQAGGGSPKGSVRQKRV